MSRFIGIKLWLKHLRTALGNLLFPPKCFGCRKLLYTGFPEYTRQAFCDACARRWRAKRLTDCPVCGLELHRCRCGLLPLRKADGIVSLLPYQAEGKGIGEKAVLYLKDKKNARLVSFATKEMWMALMVRMEDEGIDPLTVTVTYVPRDRRRRAVAGTDQARELARGLAMQGGVPCVALFSRQKKRRGEQKEKTVRQRMENVKGLFTLSSAAVQKAENIQNLIVVDDVLTTGSTLGAAVDAVRPYVKGKILCATLGRTLKAK